jgi:recombination endonuclease VII
LVQLNNPAAPTTTEAKVPYADKKKQAEYWVKYRERNRDKIRQRQKKWLEDKPAQRAKYAAAQLARKKADPEKYRIYFRNRHIISTYGITLAQYDEMAVKQGGVCAICGRAPNGTNHVERSLVIDHCHDTGKIRGLLCNNCNSGMGMIGDSVEHLEAAIAYLKKQEA